MRPDGEDEGRLAEADEAPAADSIVYSLSRAINWGSWRPQPPAAPIAALAASPPPFRSCLLSAWPAPVAARAWRCLRVLDVSHAKTETATLCHGWLLCRSTLALVLTEVVIVLPASRCGRHGQPMLEKNIRQR